MVLGCLGRLLGKNLRLHKLRATFSPPKQALTKLTSKTCFVWGDAKCWPSWMFGTQGLRWVLPPPLSNSWIINIIWLYIPLNRTPNIDCYWGGGSTQGLRLEPSCGQYTSCRETTRDLRTHRSHLVHFFKDRYQGLGFGS